MMSLSPTISQSLTCQAILFDLDGVLVDSNALTERHWRRWAQERGIPFERIAAVHHGRPTVETIREVAPHLDAEAEAAQKERREADDIENVTAFQGAHALIGDLPDERWTIATSGRRHTATKRLAHVGLPEPETLVTADDITDGKPAPEPYLLAAKRLGVDPQDCLVFEDAPAGVTSAQRAGAQVIAVTTTNEAGALSAADVVISQLANVNAEQGGNGILHVRWQEEA